MGRPLKDIKEDQVEALAKIGCTLPEMAAVLGCHEDTLRDRFSSIIKRGKEQGKMSLRHKQYQVALSGNVAMLIWLGKQYLDQSEKAEIKHDGAIQERPGVDLTAVAERWALKRRRVVGNNGNGNGKSHGNGDAG